MNWKRRLQTKGALEVSLPQESPEMEAIKKDYSQVSFNLGGIYYQRKLLEEQELKLVDELRSLNQKAAKLQADAKAAAAQPEVSAAPVAVEDLK